MAINRQRKDTDEAAIITALLAQLKGAGIMPSSGPSPAELVMVRRQLMRVVGFIDVFIADAVQAYSRQMPLQFDLLQQGATSVRPELNGGAAKNGASSVPHFDEPGAGDGKRKSPVCEYPRNKNFERDLCQMLWNAPGRVLTEQQVMQRSNPPASVKAHHVRWRKAAAHGWLDWHQQTEILSIITGTVDADGGGWIKFLKMPAS